MYGASKRGDLGLAERGREVILKALEILPSDASAAEVYGPLHAQLESRGQRLDEPVLRIASIVRARELTLVTGNVRLRASRASRSRTGSKPAREAATRERLNPRATTLSAEEAAVLLLGRYLDGRSTISTPRSAEALLAGCRLLFARHQ
jgi:hypothetical protein